MSIPSQVSAASVLTHVHEFSGELAVSSLPRLAQAAADAEGQAVVKLAADRDSGFPRLHGSIGGSLRLTCQRCQKRFDWPLQLAVDLRLVFSEHEEQAVLRSSDPYLVENDELPLRDLVEDEILLALPMLARCETCENLLAMSAEQPARKAAKAKSATDNPFAALKGQFKQKQ